MSKSRLVLFVITLTYLGILTSPRQISKCNEVLHVLVSCHLMIFHGICKRVHVLHYQPKYFHVLLQSLHNFSLQL